MYVRTPTSRTIRHVVQASDGPGALNAYVQDYGIGTAGHVKQVTLLGQSVFDAYATLDDRS